MGGGRGCLLGVISAGPNRNATFTLDGVPNFLRPCGFSCAAHLPSDIGTYRVYQNYPNMYFSTIIATALKPLKIWIPKFYEILIKRQKEMPHTSEVPS